MLKGKRILLGISGGIAAYKTPELIRQFIRAGAEVKVIATANALEFVTKLTLQTVSGNEVYADVFGSENDYSTEHISLADWGDLLLIAPATANIIGKMAGGIADDALSTSFLAFNKPVFVAPAMNTRMYEHAATRRNMDILRSSGVHFIEPAEGELACGVVGKGRMEEPGIISQRIVTFFEKDLPWKGKKILITAGPTYEKIDPVRFIGNYSSGKMGFALAEACAKKGADVVLVCGPVSLNTTNPGILRIDVESASEMFDAATQQASQADVVILCAAVADFTPAEPLSSKRKREAEDLIIRLSPTRDIAAAIGKQKKPGQVLVGFALETDDELANAESKLERKNLDFIVLNSLRNPGAGFRGDTNQISIIRKKGNRTDFPLKPKQEVSEDILNEINLYF